jgi:phosphoribosyl 1,2-cyclic phosphodiesterase
MKVSILDNDLDLINPYFSPVGSIEYELMKEVLRYAGNRFHKVMATTGNFKVLFVGTGVSTAIPNIAHVLERSKGPNPCLVCQDALASPLSSRNKRNNVSIALLFQENSKDKCVLVDVGKTMRDAVISLLPRHGVEEVHSILITHGHADAMMGLDDVRDLQKVERVVISSPDHPNGTAIGFRILSGPLPIYLTSETMQAINRVFPYITGPSQYLDKETNVIERRVALVAFNTIEDTALLNLHGLAVKCFPVWHGGKYVSLGFNFGNPGEFVYISDVKIIPQESWDYLVSLPQIQVLVLDVLDWDGIFSHMGMHEALAICDKLQPKAAYFTGMCCELGLHDDIEQYLQQRSPNYHLAYDGLVLSDFSNTL